jgi:tight adherence protein B
VAGPLTSPDGRRRTRSEASTVARFGLGPPPGLGSRGRPLLAAVVGVAVALAVTPGVGRLGAAELGFCAAVTGYLGLSLVTDLLARRREIAYETEVSLAVALVVGELDAGASASRAIGAAGAIGAEVERRLSASSGAVEDPLTRVVAVWRISVSSGIPLASLLAQVRVDLAARTAGRRDVEAAVAGPQSSATLLALLPVLGVALGSAMGADPLNVLLQTGSGRLLLCVGVTLDGVGLLWTRRLVATVKR